MVPSDLKKYSNLKWLRDWRKFHRYGCKTYRRIISSLIYRGIYTLLAQHAYWNILSLFFIWKQFFERVSNENKMHQRERERETNFLVRICIVFEQEDRTGGTTRAPSMELSFNKTQRRDKVADYTNAKIAQ